LRCCFRFVTEGHGLGVQGFGLLDLGVRLVVVVLRRESLATLDYRNTMEAVMGAIDDKERSDAYLEVMERLCREYGEALKAYDKAKEAGDPEVASRLELVVAEKSSLMQAYMERNQKGADAAMH